MSHVFLSMKIERSKAEIKKSVLGCLKGEEPDEDKLDLFVDGVIHKAENILQTRQPQEETKQDRLDKRDWAFEKAQHESMLRRFESFRTFFKDNKNRFLDESDFFTVPPYQEYLLEKELVVEQEDGKYALKEGEAYFPETLEQLGNSLDVTIEALEVLVGAWKKKVGRKTDSCRPDYVRDVFVMAECLLGLEVVRTRNTTPFNEVLNEALLLTGDSSAAGEPNFPRLIKHCFGDEQTVISMGHVYHEYNRLDLFEKHIARTPHEQFFLEEWWPDFWLKYLENQAV